MKQDTTKFESLITKAENGVIKISQIIDKIAEIFEVSDRKIITTGLMEYCSVYSMLIEGINYLSLNGVNKFVFDEEVLLNKTHFLFPHNSFLVYTQDVHYIGKFRLTTPIGTDRRKSCNHIYFDDSIKIENFARSKEIELPENFHCNNIYANQIDDVNYVYYGKVLDYVNRPSRLQKLLERREEKARIKKANETGVLLLRDRYGIPLEIGCTVVLGSRLFEVRGQKKNVVLLRPFGNTAVFRATTEEIMRIS